MGLWLVFAVVVVDMRWKFRMFWWFLLVIFIFGYLLFIIGFICFLIGYCEDGMGFLVRNPKSSKLSLSFPFSTPRERMAVRRPSLVARCISFWLF